MNREKRIKEYKDSLEYLAQKLLKDKAKIEEEIKEEITNYKVGDVAPSNGGSYLIKVERIKVDSFGGKFSIKYWGRRLKKNGEMGQWEDHLEEKY